MQRLFIMFLPVLVLAATWAAPAPARAASGVTDGAQFFSPNALTHANALIAQNRGPHPDIRVETVPAIPDSMKNEFESQGKNVFFEHWADDIGRRNHVNGVVILICKSPAHIQTVVGNETREKAFPDADRRELVSKLVAAFKAKNYDEGLLDGIRFIEAREAANLGTAHAAAPAPPFVPPPPSVTPHMPGVGTWLCLGVGILIAVVFIISIANRNRNYSAGYGPPPPGGYPPGYSGCGGYPGGGYGPGYGGAAPGGGFGRGFLGGLLGGAVGAWGYDKLTGRENTGPGYAGPGANPSQSDPTNQPDTSYSGSGGDFDSSPNSGGDFDSTPESGGGDFGGGGGDSGGGGDFGGGGGGDSGGGGGGDF